MEYLSAKKKKRINFFFYLRQHGGLRGYYAK